jgi:hypothetical protein
MIEFATTSFRLFRSMASAWRRDLQFRSLLVHSVITLSDGSVFYSAVEGWSVVDASTSASQRSPPWAWASSRSRPR